MYCIATVKLPLLYVCLTSHQQLKIIWRWDHSLKSQPTDWWSWDQNSDPWFTRYSKTCLKRQSNWTPKLVFNTDYGLMQVKCIAECSKRSILQYFQPSFSYYSIKTFVLSIFKWLLKTDFTIHHIGPSFCLLLYFGSQILIPMSSLIPI